MKADGHAADRQAIEELIYRQFGSLCWSGGRTGDWNSFSADFLPGASLYPAARPAKRQSVDAFIERLAGLAGSRLHAFRESVLGVEVCVFRNIAVAVAGCEITENEEDVNRGVEMLLLVKSDGRWQIAAQAWDMESGTEALPPELSNPWRS